jgi:hypothetical protein
MATGIYDSKEAKEVLLDFVRDMVEVWQNFLVVWETVSAILAEIRESETEESYKAILDEAGISKEDANTMIAQYEEEVSNG